MIEHNNNNDNKNNQQNVKNNNNYSDTQQSQPPPQPPQPQPIASHATTTDLRITTTMTTSHYNNMHHSSSTTHHTTQHNNSNSNSNTNDKPHVMTQQPQTLHSTPTTIRSIGQPILVTPLSYRNNKLTNTLTNALSNSHIIATPTITHTHNQLPQNNINENSHYFHRQNKHKTTQIQYNNNHNNHSNINNINVNNVNNNNNNNNANNYYQQTHDINTEIDSYQPNVQRHRSISDPNDYRYYPAITAMGHTEDTTMFDQNHPQTTNIHDNNNNNYNNISYNHQNMAAGVITTNNSQGIQNTYIPINHPATHFHRFESTLSDILPKRRNQNYVSNNEEYQGQALQTIDSLQSQTNPISHLPVMSAHSFSQSVQRQNLPIVIQEKPIETTQTPTPTPPPPAALPPQSQSQSQQPSSQTQTFQMQIARHPSETNTSLQLQSSQPSMSRQPSSEIIDMRQHQTHFAQKSRTSNPNVTPQIVEFVCMCVCVCVFPCDVWCGVVWCGVVWLQPTLHFIANLRIPNFPYIFF